MKADEQVLDMREPNQKREDEKFYIPVTFYENNGNIGGKIRPENKDSTRLWKFSLMKYKYSGAKHYEVHLDMKMDYPISRIFQNCHSPN